MHEAFDRLCCLPSDITHLRRRFVFLRIYFTAQLSIASLHLLFQCSMPSVYGRFVNGSGYYSSLFCAWVWWRRLSTLYVASFPLNYSPILTINFYLVLHSQLTPSTMGSKYIMWDSSICHSLLADVSLRCLFPVLLTSGNVSIFSRHALTHHRTYFLIVQQKYGVSPC